MTDLERNTSARDAIMGSIRQHLAASVPHDAVRAENNGQHAALLDAAPVSEPGTGPDAEAGATAINSLITIFGKNLEAVGGHCIVVHGEAELIEALSGILSRLPKPGLRIALSNAPGLEQLMRRVEVEIDEIAIAPQAGDLFGSDVGICTAQAAIAETGTLMLDSEAERHRLVSLLPPVHIAIVDAASICLTLGEALAAAQQRDPLSATITFITGPSRTADIELTLAIGVHGPQQLYVIINEGPQPAVS